MAEGFEPYHVPQQSRRDKLRVVSSQTQPVTCPPPNLHGFVPIYDPSLISCDFLTSCANNQLHHHQSNSLGVGDKQSSNPAATACSGGVVKEEGANLMGFVGGLISVSSSSSATNHLYMDPQSSVQLNPSSIQDINGSPFLYNPQGLRFLDQSFHGAGEVMVYRPEPLSVAPHESNNNNSSSNNTCAQGLSLSLSSHHSRQSSLPLELNLQRYDSSMYSAKVSGGCFLPGNGCGGGGDASTSNELSRSSVPLGPLTGYSSILKGSRFLRPAQQLLEELCDVGRGIYGDKMSADLVLLDPQMEIFSGTGISDDPQSCSSGGEQRRRKSRLMSMLDEVYKRYKQYYQQMQTVIASFESVAGVRNAAPFANLALKGMSKHFRCLKNTITEQLQFMTESRGQPTHEKGAAQGFDSPETGIYCQRSIQNAGNFGEHQPVWRPQRGLPERAVTVLRAWLFEHFLHPYPTDTDKLMLAKQTGLSRNQVSNWFINARVRLWKPMVEEIHMLETRQAQKASQKEELNIADRQNDLMPASNPISPEKISTSAQRIQDFPLKRTRNDLTGILTGSEDAVNMSYDNPSRHSRLAVGVSTASGSGGVSLTLGLHQNNGIGLADPFPITAARRFGLDANGDGYVVGGIDNPNRPFGREFVGGHLLHDFVG